MRPYYDDQWCDDSHPEPEEPEENVVCDCDNCEEPIYDCDDMAVVEDRSYHIGSAGPHVLHICMDCWEANKWDKSEELLDMIGVWYWTGDAPSAMKIALDYKLKERERQRQMTGISPEVFNAVIMARK